MGGRDHHRWETVGPPDIEKAFLYDMRVKLSMSPMRLRRQSQSQNTPPKLLEGIKASKYVSMQASHVCVYVCTYVRLLSACLPASLSGCLSVCLYVCMYVRMYVCTYAQICMHVCMCACMYVCKYVSVHPRICMHAWVAKQYPRRLYMFGLTGSANPCNSTSKQSVFLHVYDFC